MSDAPVSTDLLQSLSTWFGLAEFRPGQEDVVRAILDGQDVMAVMPTGYGKSLCFQLPALLLPGATIVVSPLISLMADQVSALRKINLPAAFVNSTLDFGEQIAVLNALKRGDVKILYVAPERFTSKRFMDALSEVDLSLFVVDEAHCVSQWGHDFRPQYLRLAPSARALGRPPVAAFTATATPEVRKDIAVALGLDAPVEFIAGFDRTNLILDVVACPGQAAKFELIEDALAENGTPAIVYTATRKNAEKVAAALERPDRPCLIYHAGLDDAERTRVQQAFMRDDAPIVVATVAFGMGIDKRDIRLVAHFDVPGSVESYYQEVGRAGRDGYPCRGLLLFNYADTRTQDFFIDGSNPPRAVVESVHDLVWARSPDALPVDLPTRDIAEKLGLRNDMQVYTALVILERQGIIERPKSADNPRRRSVRPVPPRRDTLPVDWDALARKKVWDGMRLKRMVSYAYNTKYCRRGFILDYFTGKPVRYKCGACDVCRADIRVWSAPAVVPKKSARKSSTTTRAKPSEKSLLNARHSSLGASKESLVIREQAAETDQPLTADETVLFDRLRSLRKNLAAAEGVPPYCVAHDRMLRELVRARPRTIEDLRGVRGFGPKNSAKYGPQFLAVVKSSHNNSASSEK